MMVSLRTQRGRTEYLLERNRLTRTLSETAHELDEERIGLCIQRVIRAYRESTRISNMTRTRNESLIEELPFKSIKLYRTAPKKDFLANNYIWEPYFSDVGRAIAWGEQNYLYRRITRITAKRAQEVSWNNVSIVAVEREITKLLESGASPDTIIMPVRLHSRFLRESDNRVEWQFKGGHDQVTILQQRLNVFWSSRYAPAKSIVVFDSRAGVWHVFGNEKDETDITVAIGRFADNPSKVAYFVEVLAFYDIVDESAFARIRLIN